MLLPFEIKMNFVIPFVSLLLWCNNVRSQSLLNVSDDELLELIREKEKLIVLFSEYLLSDKICSYLLENTSEILGYDYLHSKMQISFKI